jgi:nitroimidazol reductase NimA-like FMN-containing flavoprotein (pyridoxamine 5'-phosphate oxidase superfamily)
MALESSHFSHILSQDRESRAAWEESTVSQRATIRRHADRSVPDDAANILARGTVAHLGFVVDGQPFVIPFSYHYDSGEPDRLYLHGSIASRALRHLASGAPVCVTVTLLDGLVYSRSAMYHSMNYRSVVCFGGARRISREAEKAEIFERMTSRYFPGRTVGRDYEPATSAQLRGTAVVEVQIEEWSAKARRGGPKGPRDAEPDAPGTRGVAELRDGCPASASV